MFGPKQRGFWTRPEFERSLGHLKVGRRYRVVEAFEDWDRDVHDVGETWTFLGTHFVPHDDGRSLYVSLDGDREWRIPLQDRPEEQRSLLRNLERYIAVVPE